MNIKLMIVKGFSYPFSGSTYITLKNDGTLDVTRLAVNTQILYLNDYIVTKGYLDQINQNLFGTSYSSTLKSLNFSNKVNNNITIEINTEWLKGITEDKTGYNTLTGVINEYIDTSLGSGQITGIILKYNLTIGIVPGGGGSNFTIGDGLSEDITTTPHTINVDPSWLKDGIEKKGYLAVRTAVINLLGSNADNSSFKGFGSDSLTLTMLNDDKFSYGVNPVWLSSDSTASSVITSVISSYNDIAKPFTSGNNSISTYLNDNNQVEFTVNPAWISGYLNNGYNTIRAAMTGILGHVSTNINYRGFGSDSLTLSTNNEDQYSYNVNEGWLDTRGRIPWICKKIYGDGLTSHGLVHLDYNTSNYYLLNIWSSNDSSADRNKISCTFDIQNLPLGRKITCYVSFAKYRCNDEQSNTATLKLYYGGSSSNSTDDNYYYNSNYLLFTSSSKRRTCMVKLLFEKIYFWDFYPPTNNYPGYANAPSIWKTNYAMRGMRPDVAIICRCLRMFYGGDTFTGGAGWDSAQFRPGGDKYKHFVDETSCVVYSPFMPMDVGGSYWRNDSKVKNEDLYNADSLWEEL